MNLNRVLAIGRDTYIRAYPNPGFGISFGRKRIALSVRGGLEAFRWTGVRWVRTWSFLSRVNRT